MLWPEPSRLAKHLSLPETITLQRLSAPLLDQFLNEILRWFPDIQVGSESRFLEREFFLDNGLLGSDPACPYYAACLVRGETLVGFFALEKNSRAQHVTCVLAAMSPEIVLCHPTLPFAGPRLVEAAGREMGAAMVFYFSSLRSRVNQRLAERSGFALVGIMPSYDRDKLAPGRILRVYEAIYAKVLPSVEEVYEPRDENLTERTRAMRRFIADLNAAPSRKERHGSKTRG